MRLFILGDKGASGGVGSVGLKGEFQFFFKSTIVGIFCNFHGLCITGFKWYLIFYNLLGERGLKGEQG